MEHQRMITAGDGVRQRVVKIVLEHLGVEVCAVVDHAMLVPTHDSQGKKIASDAPDLGCDSLDIVELVIACEDELRIEITDEEAEALNTQTVGDLIALCERKVAAE